MAKYLGNRPTAVPLTSADIEDGTIQNVDINDVDATKLTGSIADARIPASAVTQHVTEFDDTKLRQDISALAVHSAVADNKTAHNLPNTFIEQFQECNGRFTVYVEEQMTTNDLEVSRLTDYMINIVYAYDDVTINYSHAESQESLAGIFLPGEGHVTVKMSLTRLINELIRAKLDINNLSLNNS